MTPMRSLRAVGTATLGARWPADNRPDFPGLAVWLDATAEFEIEDVGSTAGEEEPRLADRAAPGSADPEPVPWLVDADSPDYARVWRPLAGSGREPRPGLLVSVVRAGEVTAYPTPLADPPAGPIARAMARLKRPEPEARRAEILAAEVGPLPQPEPRQPEPRQAAPRQAAPRQAAPRKDYGEVRALVGMMVEVLVGRRAATQVTNWATPEVRGKLRLPRFSRGAMLKSVRLSEGGSGIEALALVRDGARTRVVALRFDRAENARWQCTALQAG